MLSATAMITLVALWACGLRAQAGPPPRVVDTVRVTVTVEQVIKVERDVWAEKYIRRRARLCAVSGKCGAPHHKVGSVVPS